MVSGDSIQCAGSTLGEHRRKRGQEERERLRQLESDFAHMGLSICQSIIEGHGGRLQADANEPRGAVFQFTLPAGSPAGV